MAGQPLSIARQDPGTTVIHEVSSRAPSWWDLAAILLVLGVVILLGSGAKQMVAPFGLANPNPISLSPSALPMYAVRTTLRMIAALAASLIFTLLYATAAAKSRRAEIVLIPILDVLQSVPVLGYLSFTVVFFVSLFPGNTLGPGCGADYDSERDLGSDRCCGWTPPAAHATRPATCPISCRVPRQPPLPNRGFFHCPLPPVN